MGWFWYKQPVKTYKIYHQNLKILTEVNDFIRMSNYFFPFAWPWFNHFEHGNGKVLPIPSSFCGEWIFKRFLKENRVILVLQKSLVSSKPWKPRGCPGTIRNTQSSGTEHKDLGLAIIIIIIWLGLKSKKICCLVPEQPEGAAPWGVAWVRCPKSPSWCHLLQSENCQMPLCCCDQRFLLASAQSLESYSCFSDPG